MSELSKIWDDILESGTKIPLYIVEVNVADDRDEPELIYFSNHYPEGELDNCHRLLAGISGGSKSVSPNTGGTSSASMSIRLHNDADGVVLSTIQNAVGNLQNRKVQIYGGYVGMSIDMMPPLFKGRVTKYSFKDGFWKIEIGDAIRQLNRECARLTSEEEPLILHGHPIIILLGLILSKDGDRTNTRYDYLPKGAGAGVDASRVDIEWIERVLHTYYPLGSVVMRFTIESRFTLGDFLKKEICKPLSMYLSVDETTGKIILIPFKPPHAIGADRHITDADMLDVPSLTPECSKIINEIKFQYDKDDSDYQMIEMLIDAESVNDRGPGSKALEISSEGLHSDLMDVQGYLSRTASRIFDRYARPPISMQVKTSFKYLTVSEGDIIQVSCKHLPDIFGKKPFLQDVPVEVLTRSVDWERGSISFKLLQSSQTYENYALIADGDNDSEASLIDECVIMP